VFKEYLARIPRLLLKSQDVVDRSVIFSNTKFNMLLKLVELEPL